MDRPGSSKLGSSARSPNAGETKGHKRKVMSRESVYNKTKAREKVERETKARLARQGATGSSSNGGRGATAASPASALPGTVSRSLQKTRSIVENPHPFRYKSFNDRLSSVHISASTALTSGRGSTLAGLDVQGVAPSQPMDIDVEDAEDEEARAAILQASTAFGSALTAWRELNLTVPFQEVLRKVQYKSLSLPLILHHREAIVDALVEALSSKKIDAHLAYEPVFDLIPRLALDLGSEFLPVFRITLSSILRGTTISKATTGGDEQAAARLVEKAFESVAALFRNVAPLILKPLEKDSSDVDPLRDTWLIVRPYMGWIADATREAEDQNDREAVDEDESAREEATTADEPETAVPDEVSAAHIPAHVRRFASEAFAHLLRRSKQSHLCRAAAFMLDDVQTMLAQHQNNHLAVGVAGIWSEVIKSVDRRLHSQVQSHLSALLLTECEQSTYPARVLVGRLLITSLVHHGHSTHLVPLYTLLIEWAKQNIPRREDAVVWLATAVGTRKGARVDDSVKPALFETLMQLTHQHKPDLPTLTLIATSMPIGRIPDLVGAGIKLIDSFRGESGGITAGFNALVLALATPSNAWAGFEQFVLPSVLSATMDTLRTSTEEQERRSALYLLSKLHEAGQLTSLMAPVDKLKPSAARWRRTIAAVVQEDVDTLSGMSTAADERPRLVLYPTLTLVPFAANTDAASGIASTLRSCLTASPDEKTHLALIASALAGLITATSPSHSLDICADVCTLELCQSVLEKHGDQRLVLVAVLNLFKAAQAAGSVLTLPDADIIVVHLWKSLMSEDEELRRAATGWLALCATCNSSPTAELISQMDVVENVPLQVDTSRDRNVRMRALTRDLARWEDSAQKAAAAKTICRYVVGSLKINLAPLWSESRKALAELADGLGDEIWNIGFQELTAERAVAIRDDKGRDEPAHEESALLPEADASDESADVNFQDPQRKSREQGIAHQWNMCQRSLPNIITQQLKDLQAPQGRLDVANYRAQLLLLFTDVPRLVERHNRPFMEHFFGTIVGQEGNLLSSTIDTESTDSSLTVRERLERLSSYLRVFVKVSNPKALYRSNDLWDYHHRLLALGEVKVQRLALDCILTWKEPAHTSYAEKLAHLLDRTKFRDQLVAFDLSRASESIQPEHRKLLLPVVVRLLYGLAIARKTSASSAGQKTAILNALSDCATDELEVWVTLMLDAFGDQLSLPRSGNDAMDVSPNPPRAYSQQQNGFLSLLGDSLKHLGAQLVPFWPQLLAVTINLAHHNSLQAAQEGPGRASAQSRDIRQTSVRRIADFFRNPASESFAQWGLFTPAIFAHVVGPRLPTFAAENTQSPSALLELFSVWSLRVNTMHLFVDGDSSLLPSLYKTLSVPSVKNAVISIVIDIVNRLLASCQPEPENATPDEAVAIRERVVLPYISELVLNLTPLIQRTSAQSQPDAMLGRQIQTLASIAVFVTRSDDAVQILDLLGPVMRKSNRFVPEKSKADLLATFRDLLLLADTFSDPSSELFGQYYRLFASMWSKLRSRAARANLGAVFQQIARVDPSLGRVAEWIKALNSFSEKRLDEPDFDRRLDVFDSLSEDVASKLSLREWQPLLHNMLFFIQDTEELVLRSNASTILKRFVEIAAKKKDEDLVSLFTRTVWPILRKILRSRSELVRKAVLPVLDTAVKHLPDHFGEMQGLLAGEDEEANFFNNVLHIQAHRRARALRRLADYAETGALRSKTIADVFAPLIGHALESGHTSLDGDHNLANETIACLGRLARHMQWGAYNALLWTYLRQADAKTSGEKIFVRTALAILDNFHFSMAEEVSEENDPAGSDEEDEPQQAADNRPRFDRVKVVSSVTGKLLPALMGYLEHHDDDTNDAIRLPIAVGVVRVVECLPPADKEVHLGKLLNVLANVFRSKSQETRDLARETLCKAAVALGPSRLPQIVREQKRALTRGPQLAVLAYNVHSVLVHLMQRPSDALGSLDNGVEDIIAIAAEDLFGQTGEDRESIEYKTKVREQRQSKSLDTFELVAKIIVPHRIGALLVPLRAVLQRTEVPRAVKAVEDALRRIASGINSNTAFDHATLLGLCHDLISRNAEFLKPRKGAAHGRNQRSENKEGQHRDHFAVNAYRLVGFGLDVFITAMRRSRFDLSDADVLARLDPLLHDVGNTLFAADVTVVSLGLRATSALLRCSELPSLPAALPVLIRQTTTIVGREASAASETCQAGLRVLTIMLRDCPQATFKEKQLADLLDLTLPDIEEPNVQSAIFSFVRAIISRRFVVPEIYDVMDKVAEMMVTNQDAQVREVSRAAFLQFLLDYPQGRGRLRNQMEFLAKNLAYVHESGRLSVMELLTAILAKFSDEVLTEYSELLFVAVIMVLANDESRQCRERGAELAKALVRLVDDSHRTKFIEMAHAWAESPTLACVGMQVYGLLLESDVEASSGWTTRATKAVRKVLQLSADELEQAEQTDGGASELEWQLPYQALQLASKLSKQDGAVLKDNVRSARRLLLFPHSWVRAASCRLLGSFFATTQPDAPSADGSVTGLEALVDCARKLSLQLRSDVVDDALSLQIIKNLLWIGKAFARVQVKTPVLKADTSAAGEDDGSDEEAEEVREHEEDPTENPLAWLFTKLSYQARRGYEDCLWHGPTAILRWFAAMAQTLDPPSRVEAFLPHIITPLFRILDADVTTRRQAPGADEHAAENLQTLASEVQDLVQEKVGTSAYSSVYSSIRSRAMEKRRQRKTDRLMRGIENPEREAERKRERNEAKHQSRKRKNRGFAEGKGVKTTQIVKRTRKGPRQD
ncbi:unnamed protein product [Parajaminaea phylloscopi]